MNVKKCKSAFNFILSSGFLFPIASGLYSHIAHACFKPPAMHHCALLTPTFNHLWTAALNLSTHRSFVRSQAHTYIEKYAPVVEHSFSLLVSFCFFLRLAVGFSMWFSACLCASHIYCIIGRAQKKEQGKKHRKKGREKEKERQSKRHNIHCESFSFQINIALIHTSLTLSVSLTETEWNRWPSLFPIPVYNKIGEFIASTHKLN